MQGVGAMNFYETEGPAPVGLGGNSWFLKHDGVAVSQGSAEITYGYCFGEIF